MSSRRASALVFMAATLMWIFIARPLVAAARNKNT
jgi:hypothetical protein